MMFRLGICTFTLCVASVNKLKFLCSKYVVNKTGLHYERSEGRSWRYDVACPLPGRLLIEMHNVGLFLVLFFVRKYCNDIVTSDSE